MDEGKRIVARVILEMLGTPKDYIEKTIKDYVAKIKEDENLKVISEHFEDAIEKDKFFSCFAELEISFSGVKSISGFCLDFMPSSLEILEPENVSMRTNDLSDFFNDLLAKLHQVDMVAKSANAQNKNLRKNSVIIMKSLVKMILQKGPHNLDELSAKIGLRPENLEAFLKSLAEDKLIKFSDGKYALP